MSEHHTTMLPGQRAMLARTLCQLRGAEIVASLNDSQIHEQWLFESNYEGGVDHLTRIEALAGSTYAVRQVAPGRFEHSVTLTGDSYANDPHHVRTRR